MPKVPPGFNALVATTGANVAELIRRHSTPVFRVTDDRGPEFEGTGVLLCVEGRYLLASAAHVFDGVLAGGVHLLIEGRETSPLTRPPRLTLMNRGARVFDLIDLGYVELTDDEVHGLGRENFVAVEAGSDRYERHWYQRFLLLGYPGKNQHKNYVTQTYHVNQTYYTAPELEIAAYKRAGLAPESHIAVEFKRSQIEGPRGRGGTPNFIGMSGGGFWLFNPYETYYDDSPIPLIGFLAGPAPRNKKSLFGSRLGALLRLM